ncbi:uncharacterized protein [Nicotiana tomentosiformis]|uniref:uncharacterized protein n=1 Tax=Nicotiana tomentosiformis TaxID=4098 RepID=UPI00388C71B4
MPFLACLFLVQLVQMATMAHPSIKVGTSLKRISMLLYVISLKILSNSLNPLLTNLISTNQSGFVKERLISENVLLAQEIVQSISHMNKRGNIVLELHMAKAYDRMSWTLVTSVLRKFGFSEF